MRRGARGNSLSIWGSLRKRVWYRAIDDLERGIINLTVRVVENVKSHNLVQALEGIARANIQI